MIPRILEPEVMDTAQEAVDYDAMNHAEVNQQFVDDVLSACPEGLLNESTRVLDVGTGTALIPIELASRDLGCPIIGIDLAAEMLAVGKRNIAAAGFSNIQLELVDAKQLPYADESFDVVISNSIVHHIPEPAETFAELRRVVRAGGLLFVRDLLRPNSDEQVEHLVTTYAGDESLRQQQLFRQSLHAALRIDELTTILKRVDISPDRLLPSSDRHWTLTWQRP